MRQKKIKTSLAQGYIYFLWRFPTFRAYWFVLTLSFYVTIQHNEVEAVDPGLRRDASRFANFGGKIPSKCSHILVLPESETKPGGFLKGKCFAAP